MSNEPPKLTVMVDGTGKFYGTAGFAKLDEWARKNNETWSRSARQLDALGLQPDDRARFMAATLLGVNIGLATELNTMAVNLAHDAAMTATKTDVPMLVGPNGVAIESEPAKRQPVLSIHQNDEGYWLDILSPSGKMASVLLQTNAPMIREAIDEATTKRILSHT